MKKILFAFILMTATQLHARSFDMWRSTMPSGAWNNFLVATGPVYLDSIVCTSSSNASSFVFNNTTHTTMITSTSSVFDGLTQREYNIKIPLSKGFMFTTTGAAQWFIRWDYYQGIPAGKESDGYMR